MSLNLYNELVRLTPAEVGTMHQALITGPVPGKKSECCKALADLAHSHGWDIARLKQAAQNKTSPSEVAELSELVNRTLRSVASVEAKITSTETIAGALRKELGVEVARISTMNNSVCDLLKAVRINTNSITDVSSELSILKNELAQLQSAPKVDIDQTFVNASVVQAVADAFGAFKSAVQPEQAAVVADIAVALASAQTVLVEDAFGVAVLDAKGASMSITHWHRTDAPAIDACHIWTPETLRHLVLAEQSGSTLANIWMGGEKGAGKSETARQYAARTGRGFTRINFQRFTTVEDFLGATGLRAGSTEFVPGPFLESYSTPGSVILLDEITNADPGVLNSLNGFLEPGAAVTFGGKVWSKAPGVMILAADNTLGNGDQSGRYAGTRAQGAALLNRFGQVVHMTFLPRDVEREAVIKRTGCSAALADHVLDAINVARAKVQTGEIIDAPSIRNVIAFIESLRILPVRAAWNATIAAAQPAESAVALEQVYASCVNESKIVSL